ncbi:MAG: HAMP domain-containing histidine kinase [Deltaproteobacteria bacterium]|nr:HAMP domain-containing histidine kinase [Deltaproteobacteria bacterium]
MKNRSKNVTAPHVANMAKTLHLPSHFAPPGRATDAELLEEVKAISGNQLIDGLMNIANGLFAVLNEDRQILALNESFLKFMGIENASEVLGLRPGEYAHCVHSCDMPGGCGTSPYCATCGAVISIMSALDSDQPQENICSLTVEKDNKEVELLFQVRCCPVKIDGTTFLLFFLQDISVQQQRANLDSTFLHDINNLLTALYGKSELFQIKNVWDAERFRDLQKIINRMAEEFAIHQMLTGSLSTTYQPLYREVAVNALLDDVAETFAGHPLCAEVTLEITKLDDPSILVTDPNLVHRILINMVTNALEAAGPGETVRVFTEPGGNAITFCVWNRKHIPPHNALRIFKRNFTTKEQHGHGLGTYSMKLFGENILGGIVNFTTSEEEGTTFRLSLLQQ